MLKCYRTLLYETQAITNDNLRKNVLTKDDLLKPEQLFTARFMTMMAL